MSSHAVVFILLVSRRGRRAYGRWARLAERPEPAWQKLRLAPRKIEMDTIAPLLLRAGRRIRVSV